jgi:hypothetical protein
MQQAKELFVLDTHYIVRPAEATSSIGSGGSGGAASPEAVPKAEVCIVDPFSGRVMAGRRWSDGMHQSIEAKEGARVVCLHVRKGGALDSGAGEKAV